MKTIIPLSMAILFVACNAKKVSETQTSTDSAKAATDTTARVDKLAETGFNIMHREKFGEIGIDLSSEMVVKALGEAETKSNVEVSQVDGANVQTWMYPSKGLEISFSEDENKKWTVASYSITEKSTLKSSRGIGIGSSREEVLKAYEKDIGEQSDEGSIIAGTVYGGIVFWLGEGKVRSIFVGTMAD
jgi:hypothetical protein